MIKIRNMICRVCGKNFKCKEDCFRPFATKYCRCASCTIKKFNPHPYSSYPLELVEEEIEGNVYYRFAGFCELFTLKEIVVKTI